MSIVTIIATHRKHLLLLHGLVAGKLSGVVQTDLAAISIARATHSQSFRKARIMGVHEATGVTSAAYIALVLADVVQLRLHGICLITPIKQVIVTLNTAILRNGR